MFEVEEEFVGYCRSLNSLRKKINEIISKKYWNFKSGDWLYDVTGPDGKDAGSNIIAGPHESLDVLLLYYTEKDCSIKFSSVIKWNTFFEASRLIVYQDRSVGLTSGYFWGNKYHVRETLVKELMKKGIIAKKKF